MTDQIVAVDAYGGDKAPGEIVLGAVAAAQRGAHILLVGKERELTSLLTQRPSTLEVVDAPDVIGMEEHPVTAVRSHPLSSLVVAAHQVENGKAQSLVSAGNSGAVLAAALFVIGRVAGVDRPAIGASIPTASGRTLLIDAGANTDCKPEWLTQFALMGAIVSKELLGVATPKVALLSNGEEEGKGNRAVVAAFEHMASVVEPRGARFVGNMEGRDIFSGRCDVLVADGFVGNVLLKAAEGTGEFLLSTLKSELGRSWRGMAGGLLIRSRVSAIRAKVDYRSEGGALLVGVKGEVVIAHGRSDAIAICNAIGLAQRAMDAGISERLGRALADPPAAAKQPKEASL